MKITLTTKSKAGKIRKQLDTIQFWVFHLPIQKPTY